MLRIWLMENNKNEKYSYDGNSNRINFTQNGVTATLEYYKNNAGGNTPLVKYDGNWWYTYDKNGNRISKGKVKLLNGNSYVPYTENSPGNREGNVVIDKSYEYWEYTWDLNNRLIKVEQKKDEYDDELVCVKYTYDALNFRIEKESLLDQTVTKYVYGRNGALTYEEFLQNDTVVGSRSYAYFNDQIIGFTDVQGTTEQKRYAVTDILGTVSQIYSEDNELLWDSSYTVFGIPDVATTDKFDGVFEFHGMFTGCQYDNETGLTYHWNRWRNEEGNNFISPDPARDGGNWWNYCNSNPLVYTDPNGKVPAHLKDYPGWSHHAPQKVFGYFDAYDAMSTVLIFNINGTKMEGNDFTLRMWKGTYGLAGVGGEIGLYSPGGRSFNRDDLESLGITSSTFDLFDNETGEKLVYRTEEEPSFWTTAFNPSKHRNKSNLTAEFNLNFKDEESAEKFISQIQDKTDIAKEYYWNNSINKQNQQNVNVVMGADNKSVTITYGNKPPEANENKGKKEANNE